MNFLRGFFLMLFLTTISSMLSAGTEQDKTCEKSGLQKRSVEKAEAEGEFVFDLDKIREYVGKYIEDANEYATSRDGWLEIYKRQQNMKKERSFQCKVFHCDIAGSISDVLDDRTGQCRCKNHATGPLCTECKTNTFHLSASNLYGCISCFCMGVTSQCSSSNWYRTQETASFVQNSAGFTLVDESQRDVIRDGFTIDRDSRELGFKEFSRYPTEFFYWQLPYAFLGDKITSYGGYLNYTIRYIPPPGGQNSPNSAADVEINGNDIRLLYFRKIPVPANRKETISVPLLEQYWQHQDGRMAHREHLLMALANLDALLIKATYITSTREAHISDVILDYAVSHNTSQERAYSVEQCACPQGYIGLSCQECASGYTRSLRGLYLGLCEACSCSGHSDECDPRTGVCRNCRGHTTGDFCEQCEVGYVGDPRTGQCTRE